MNQSIYCFPSWYLASMLPLLVSCSSFQEFPTTVPRPEGSSRVVDIKTQRRVRNVLPFQASQQRHRSAKKGRGSRTHLLTHLHLQNPGATGCVTSPVSLPISLDYSECMLLFKWIIYFVMLSVLWESVVDRCGNDRFTILSQIFLGVSGLKGHFFFICSVQILGTTSYVPSKCLLWLCTYPRTHIHTCKDTHICLHTYKQRHTSP